MSLALSVLNELCQFLDLFGRKYIDLSNLATIDVGGIVELAIFRVRSGTEYTCISFVLTPRLLPTILLLFSFVLYQSYDTA